MKNVQPSRPPKMTVTPSTELSAIPTEKLIVIQRSAATKDLQLLFANPKKSPVPHSSQSHRDEWDRTNTQPQQFFYSLIPIPQSLLFSH